MRQRVLGHARGDEVAQLQSNNPRYRPDVHPFANHYPPHTKGSTDHDSDTRTEICKTKPFASALCAIAMSALVFSMATFPALTEAANAPQAKKPNILIIWGDDIGYWNVTPTTRA
jgi:hypothetical protein